MRESHKGPILYIFFTKDISDAININHIKFADDLRMWSSDQDTKVIETHLNENVGNLLDWSRKWRQGINIQKTEAMCFAKTKTKIDVTANGRVLEQVSEKRILGVTLDDKLKFNPHIEACASRALAQVTKLSILTNGLNGANAELLLTLYKTCIRPTLEYGYPVWCSVSDITALERVQYQALRKATGALHGSPSSALNTITNIIPIDLRLDEILLNSYLKIARKEDNNHLKIKINRLLQDPKFMDHKIITPIHKLSMVLRTIPSDINISNVEKQLHISITSCLAPKATGIDYTPGIFGSSGTRSSYQAEAALKTAKYYLANTKGDIVAFTDGSALGNPGPCGAGSAIFWKGMDSIPSLHKRPVSKLSSSYHGELQAIDLALQVIANKMPPVKNVTVHIITDCQSALQAAIKCDITKNFGTLLNNIQKSLICFRERKIRTVIYWTAGHIKLDGNELADKLAKEAAAEARDNTIPESPLSTSEIKNSFRKYILKRWQKRWDQGKDSRYTHTLIPQVKLGDTKVYQTDKLKRNS